MTDWAAILADHGPAVWRAVYRVLHHAADAHDAYQEAFLAAWQLDRRKPVADWRPVLVCLATRKAIDRLRRRTRAAARTEPLDAAADPPAAGGDPSEPARMAELLGRLRAGVAALPAKQAEVVWLSCAEGLPHQEIADQLGLPPGEVRVLLHRGRARLSRLLAADLTRTREVP